MCVCVCAFVFGFASLFAALLFYIGRRLAVQGPAPIAVPKVRSISASGYRFEELPWDIIRLQCVWSPF